jgi:hypothetical protein
MNGNFDRVHLTIEYLNIRCIEYEAHTHTHTVYQQAYLETSSLDWGISDGIEVRVV